MKYVLITLSLFLALFLEGTFFTIPIVLSVLILYTILFQEANIFLFAGIFGILLDVVTFRLVGVSSLFFVTSLGIIFLYKRKFELQSIFFVGVSIFLLSLFYCMVFAYHESLQKALICGFIFVGVYWMIFLLEKRKSSSVL